MYLLLNSQLLDSGVCFKSKWFTKKSVFDAKLDVTKLVSVAKLKLSNKYSKNRKIILAAKCGCTLDAWQGFLCSTYIV